MTTTTRSQRHRLRVFVYGTLREGYGNHRLLARAIDEGRASRVGGHARTERPATLVNVGWFPAITTLHAGPCSVVGELYSVDDQTLAELDRLEGVPRLYTRERVRVAVSVDDARGMGAFVTTVPALTYVWAGEAEGLDAVPSGDFGDVRAPSPIADPFLW